MKFIKKFEEINTDFKKVEKGDYVIMRTLEEGLLKFFSENIGTVEMVMNNNLNVRYDFTPKGYEYEFADNTRWFPISMLKFSSKNREDLESILASKKYNL